MSPKAFLAADFAAELEAEELLVVFVEQLEVVEPLTS
jgi:hypothetical protein